MKQDKILVGSALFNWSETQRMIEISDALYQMGYEIVFIGEGKYDYLLKEKPYIRQSVPFDVQWYTPKRIEKLLGMGQYGNQYASADEIRQMIAEETAIIEKYQPACVLTGYRMTLTISAKLTGTPIVWCLAATLSKPYLQQTLEKAKEFDSLKRSGNVPYQQIRALFEDKIACERLLGKPKTSKEWNRLLEEKNLPPLGCDFDIYTGDLNLMSDARELFGELPESEHYQFIGPIWNNEKIEMPPVVDAVLAQNNGRKKVLISIGSGGKKELFQKILHATLGFDCDFFVSVVGILDESDLAAYPENYHFCDKFPLIEIVQCCDAALIQGGQGTLYPVIVGKCPFVSLPATFEQRLNVENVQRHSKCCEIIQTYDISERSIQTALQAILTQPEYRHNAAQLAESIQAHFEDRRLAPRIAAQRIDRMLHGKT